MSRSRPRASRRRTDRLGADVVVGHRQHPAHEAQRDVLAELLVLVARHDDLDGREDEERAEQVEHPAEPLDDRGAGEDEPPAQHQGDEDAEQQHAVLVHLGHREGAHDQQEDEEVVDRERVLGDVAGDERRRGAPGRRRRTGRRRRARPGRCRPPPSAPPRGHPPRAGGGRRSRGRARGRPAGRRSWRPTPRRARSRGSPISGGTSGQTPSTGGLSRRRSATEGPGHRDIPQDIRCRADEAAAWGYSPPLRSMSPAVSAGRRRPSVAMSTGPSANRSLTTGSDDRDNVRR